MKLAFCKSCGKKFLLFPDDDYHYCRICNANWRKEQNRQKEETENLKWQEQRKKSAEQFENIILSYSPIPFEIIKPSNNTLYVIGNGFDLMHRVPSSYYSFRDSLGKNNDLRRMLETALTPEDIWADFEFALGNLNLDLMSSRSIVDMWLDNCGFYDKDSGAAEFYLAVETAASPISIIVNSLQPAFRKWVSKLTVGTNDRPLKKLICPEGKALSFNYTEFAETLYGIKDICYIHGCRKNKKEKLILGHSPNMEGVFHEKERKPRSYRQTVIDVAQENVLNLIGQYDEEITKNSQKIIDKHRSFFDSLKNITQVIVVGHSLSPVDWDYFREIKNSIPCAQWYFGIFGLNDIHNLEMLIAELGLNNCCVFRTDKIWTEPNITNEAEINREYEPKPKIFQNDDTVVSIIHNYDLKIDDNYELVLPARVRKVVFLDKHIFVILDEIDRDILLFDKEEDSWKFIARLERFEHQSLITRRLNHIFLSDKELTFVYNNRVRKYDITTGRMIFNEQIRGAKNMIFRGEEMIEKFIS